MKFSINLRNRAVATIAVIMAIIATGCNTIFDDSDCVDSANTVQFTHEYNLKFADAFGKEVDNVALYIFSSETGLLVDRMAMPAHQLSANHELTLRVQPGEYDLLVWGGNADSHFAIPVGEAGVSTLADINCMLKLDDKGESSGRLNPLFHGLQHVTLPYASPKRPNKVTLDLTKNTNTLRVLLRYQSGDPVDNENFEVTVTDRNSVLNHDNTLGAGSPFVYRPFYTNSDRSASLHEFSLSRLFMENETMLTVKYIPEQRVVLEAPVIDYVLLVKSYEHSTIPNQEYLDRQDNYNITFFLDKANRWISTPIIINDWLIVDHNRPME